MNIFEKKNKPKERRGRGESKTLIKSPFGFFLAPFFASAIWYEIYSEMALFEQISSTGKGGKLDFTE
jgi:hypothetical protein